MTLIEPLLGIERLSLKGSPTVTNESFPLLLAFPLHELSLASCDQLTAVEVPNDKAAVILPALPSSIRELSCEHPNLVELFPHRRSLTTFRGNSNDAAIALLAEKAERLELEGTTIRQLPDVSHLSLVNCRIETLIQTDDLLTLDLSHSLTSIDSLLRQKLTSIRTLALRGCGIDDQMFQQLLIAVHPSVEMDLRENPIETLDCRGFTKRTLETLSRAQLPSSIRELYLPEVTDDQLRCFVYLFPHLTHFSMEGSGAIAERVSHFSDQLENIDLSNTCLEDPIPILEWAFTQRNPPQVSFIGCPIRKLDLGNHEWVSDQLFERVKWPADSIREISLANQSDLTTSNLPWGDQIVSLDLTNCPIGPPSLPRDLEIGRFAGHPLRVDHLPTTLQALSLSNVDDEQIRSFYLLSELRELFLEGSFSDQGLLELQRLRVELRSLSIRSSKATHRGIWYLRDLYRRAHSLTFRVDLSKADKPFIDSIPDTAREVDFAFSRLPQKRVRRLTKRRHYSPSTLSLAGCYVVQEDVMRLLTQRADCRSLDLRGTGIPHLRLPNQLDDDFLQSLQLPEKMRFLTLMNCRQITQIGWESLVNKLLQCQQLQSIVIQQAVNLHDDDLNLLLQSLPQLDAVTIEGAAIEGFKHLPPKLRILEVRGARELTRLPRKLPETLQVADFSNCTQLSDKAITPFLGRLPKSVIRVNLSNTLFAAQSRRLTKFRHGIELIAQNCPLEDTGARRLAALPLRRLNLEGCLLGIECAIDLHLNPDRPITVTPPQEPALLHAGYLTKKAHFDLLQRWDFKISAIQHDETLPRERMVQIARQFRKQAEISGLTRSASLIYFRNLNASVSSLTITDPVEELDWECLPNHVKNITLKGDCFTDTIVIPLLRNRRPHTINLSWTRTSSRCLRAIRRPTTVEFDCESPHFVPFIEEAKQLDNVTFAFRKSEQPWFQRGLQNFYRIGIGTSLNKSRRDLERARQSNSLAGYYLHMADRRYHPEFLVQAAHDGHGLAQFEIYRRLDAGEEIEVEPNDARHWLEAAAGNEIRDAQAQLALITQDDDEKRRLCEIAAARGNASAINLLGELYEEDDRVDEAIALYERALEEGVGKAAFNLAIIYRYTRRNPEMMIHYYSRAAELDHPGSLYELGDRHRRGYEVEENLDLAENLLHRAAIAGHQQAANLLGDLYREGAFGEVQMTRAALYYRMASNSEDPIIQTMIGQAYYYGWGDEEINNDQAFEWFSRAGDHPPAIYMRGLCHRDGRGTLESRDQALSCFEQLPDNPMAIYQLGLLYREENPDEAIRYFERGVADGMDESRVELARILLARDDEIRAMQLLDEAMENDHEEAGYLIGLHLLGREGREVEVYEAFLHSHQHSFYPATCEVGKCYEKGIGVEPSRDRALEFYEIAAPHVAEARRIIAVKFTFGERMQTHHLKIAAQMGDPRAHYLVGHAEWHRLHTLAQRGRQIAQHQLDAVYSHYRKAVEGGDGEAAYVWSCALKCRHMGQNDEAESRRLLEEAVALHYPRAYLDLSDMIGEEDPDEALRLRVAATELPWTEALVESHREQVFLVISNSYRERGDMDEAVRWLVMQPQHGRLRAQLEHLATAHAIPQAQRELAILLQKEKKPGEAAQLFHAAAKAGDLVAMRYWAGCQVSDDPDGAIATYRRAIEREDIPSMRLLALLLRNAESDLLLVRAANLGDIEACQRVGEGLANENDPQGADYLARAANDGNVAAIRGLAYCYEHGVGRPQDDEMASTLYHRAAKGRDEEAIVWVASQLLEQGTDEGIAEGRRMLKESAGRRYSPAQFLYGTILMQGPGMIDVPAGERWIQASLQGSSSLG